ncbi:MAG: Carboxyl-terminal processing protease, partial [Parcubacteria group bacterium GW2011_GWA2_40_8]
ASEILAGALSENLNIPLVGQKTFGKGSVQSLESISDGSAVKITVAHWLTPNGISINNEGIKPTVEITATETSENTQKDAQYEKAKEILLQRINNN